MMQPARHIGQPVLDETETTYVERLNGTLRQHCKLFTRKTYAFISKKQEMLEAAIALWMAHYNFCWIHRTLKVTPAMKSGIATEPRSLDKLFSETVG